MSKLPEQKRAGFFQMSTTTLQRISSEGGNHNILATYIVLCNGVNGRISGRCSTHGANSVAIRTAMTRRAAEESMEWLTDKGFISKGAEPSKDSATNKSHARWHILDDQNLDIAVSKQFVEGAKGSSKDAPIMRIMHTVNGKEVTSRNQAIRDSLLLYCALLQNQSYADYAGVDPKVWHREYKLNTEPEILSDTNWVVMSFTPQDNECSVKQFVFGTLGEIQSQDEEQQQMVSNRFRLAMGWLKYLSLVYEVRVIWDGNPLDAVQRRTAEPLATHYIKDSSSRSRDLYVEKEVTRLIGSHNGYESLYQSDGTFHEETLGSFRMIAPNGKAKSINMVGQLRVKYEAKTASAFESAMVEHERTSNFITRLERV